MQNTHNASHPVSGELGSSRMHVKKGVSFNRGCFSQAVSQCLRMGGREQGDVHRRTLCCLKKALFKAGRQAGRQSSRQSGRQSGRHKSCHLGRCASTSVSRRTRSSNLWQPSPWLQMLGPGCTQRPGHEAPAHTWTCESFSPAQAGTFGARASKRWKT